MNIKDETQEHKYVLLWPVLPHPLHFVLLRGFGPAPEGDGVALLSLIGRD